MWNRVPYVSLKYQVFSVGDGWSGVAAADGKLIRSTLPRESRRAAVEALEPPADAEESGDDPILTRAEDLIVRMFHGEFTDMDLPLYLSHLPPFTRRVLECCSRIPAGQILSYGQLAAQAGNPRAARAVGQVMHRNPLAPLVPCHRVTGGDGSLTGFGAGLEMKARMLQREGWQIDPGPREMARLRAREMD